MALLPGTRLLLEGFYKVRFQLGEAVGRSVMYVRGGRMLGGNSALYAKPDDTMDFARQIASLIDSPDERLKLGEAGLNRIKNVLAWEHQAQSLLKVYASLLKSNTGKP